MLTETVIFINILTDTKDFKGFTASCVVPISRKITVIQTTESIDSANYDVLYRQKTQCSEQRTEEASQKHCLENGI